MQSKNTKQIWNISKSIETMNLKKKKKKAKQKYKANMKYPKINWNYELKKKKKKVETMNWKLKPIIIKANMKIES